MKVKDGDIIDFVGISWNDYWEFDHPTVLLKPVIKVYECGTSVDSVIEDICIELVCDEDVDNDPFEELCGWRGWKLSNLKKVVRDRFKGKDTWKTKLREIEKQTIKFYKDKNDEIQFEIIDIQKIKP